jgi:hypothetical protein
MISISHWNETTFLAEWKVGDIDYHVWIRNDGTLLETIHKNNRVSGTHTESKVTAKAFAKEVGIIQYMIQHGNALEKAREQAALIEAEKEAKRRADKVARARAKLGKLLAHVAKLDLHELTDDQIIEADNIMDHGEKE